VYKFRQNLIRFSLVSIALSITGCSTLLGQDKQFTNETLGAMEIIHYTFLDKKQQQACRSGSKQEIAQCKKEVEAMSKKMLESQNDH